MDTYPKRRPAIPGAAILLRPTLPIRTAILGAWQSRRRKSTRTRQRGRQPGRLVERHAEAVFSQSRPRRFLHGQRRQAPGSRAAGRLLRVGVGGALFVVLDPFWFAQKQRGEIPDSEAWIRSPSACSDAAVLLNEFKAASSVNSTSPSACFLRLRRFHLITRRPIAEAVADAITLHVRLLFCLL